MHFPPDAADDNTDNYTHAALANLIGRTDITPNQYLNPAEQFDPDLNLHYLKHLGRRSQCRW